MPREIKFRAWDEKRKTMFTPYYSYLPKGMTRKRDFFVGINGGGLEVSEYEGKGYWRRFPIMQYTGLKDRNGKDIYEGDIRQFDDMGEEGYEYKEGFDFKNRAVVVFENGRFTLDNFMSSNSSVLEEIDSHEELYQTLENSEYLGNIYEDPELLKDS